MLLGDHISYIMHSLENRMIDSKIIEFYMFLG